MPRDAKGNFFGVRTMVNTPEGKMKVSGFSAGDKVLTHEDLKTLETVYSKEKAPVKAFYWYDCEVMDPESNPYKDHIDTTDLCWVDVAYRDKLEEGKEMPTEPSAIRDALKEHSPEAGYSCKVVWGADF